MSAELMRPWVFVDAARMRCGNCSTGVLSRWFRLVGMAEVDGVVCGAEDGRPAFDTE